MSSILLIILTLSGCGSGSTANTVSLSGTAIDGYISGAKACLDINSNGICESTEPTTTTLSDGTFSFVDVEVPANALFPVIVSGGIDTATNKPFTGELKNIINSATIVAGIPLYVTPLTDLIATSFLKSPTKDAQAFIDSKKEIAQIFNLSEDDVMADPMTNVAVFAKTQEVQQMKILLEITVIKAKGGNLTEADSLALQQEIKDALIAQIKVTTDGNLDMAKVMNQVEIISKVTIPQNEKTFIIAQTTEIQKALTTLVDDITIDINSLDEFQAGLEAEQEVAQTRLKSATVNEIIEVVFISDTNVLIQSRKEHSGADIIAPVLNSVPTIIYTGIPTPPTPPPTL